MYINPRGTLQITFYLIIANSLVVYHKIFRLSENQMGKITIRNNEFKFMFLFKIQFSRLRLSQREQHFYVLVSCLTDSVSSEVSSQIFHRFTLYVKSKTYILKK